MKKILRYLESMRIMESMWLSYCSNARRRKYVRHGTVVFFHHAGISWFADTQQYTEKVLLILCSFFPNGSPLINSSQTT